MKLALAGVDCSIRPVIVCLVGLVVIVSMTSSVSSKQFRLSKQAARAAEIRHRREMSLNKNFQPKALKKRNLHGDTMSQGDPRSDYYLVSGAHERGMREDNFGHESFRNLDVDKAQVANRRANSRDRVDFRSVRRNTISTKDPLNEPQEDSPEQDLVTAMPVKYVADAAQDRNVNMRAELSPVSTFWKFIMITVSSILILGLVSFILLVIVEWYRAEPSEMIGSEISASGEDSLTGSGSSTIGTTQTKPTKPIATGSSSAILSTASV